MRKIRRHFVFFLSLNLLFVLILGCYDPSTNRNTTKDSRQKQIERGFSVWDGSHRALTRLIKQSMNDPGSYEHVETVYWDMKNYLIVRTTFRGKNVFGGFVKNWVKAKCDLDGNVIEIIEQGS